MAHGFEELMVWRNARVLTRRIYAVTAPPRFRTDLSLRDQMRRAAVSVMANIAEGFERRGSQVEFARFLLMAKGSCGELRCHLYVASDQQYVDAQDFTSLSDDAAQVSRMLQGLIRRLREAKN